MSSHLFHFSFFFFFTSSFSRSFPGAKPPLSPPFHPHSLLSDDRSVQVGCTRFSRCCYLIIDLCSPLAKGTGPGVSRSHLISAVQLGSWIESPFFLFLLLFSFFLPFLVFPREISRQDRLGTTIANSLDPWHPLFRRELFSLGHRTHRFLAIVQRFVHLSIHPQPMQQYR